MSDEARDFIRRNYQPDDKLAVVMLKHPQVWQNIAKAKVIVTDWYQQELARKNADGWNVHLSVNALLPDAKNRRSESVGEIRHIFLDFDEEADKRIRRLIASREVPAPNEMIRTSIDPEIIQPKYQLLWRVEGFTKESAEQLTKSLAAAYQADLQPFDVSRTCRLPGFENCKYDPPQLVTADHMSNAVYKREQFPVHKIGSPEWVLSRIKTVTPEDLERSAAASRSTARLREFVQQHAR